MVAVVVPDPAGHQIQLSMEQQAQQDKHPLLQMVMVMLLELEEQMVLVVELPLQEEAQAVVTVVLAELAGFLMVGLVDCMEIITVKPDQMDSSEDLLPTTVPTVDLVGELPQVMMVEVTTHTVMLVAVATLVVEVWDTQITVVVVDLITSDPAKTTALGLSQALVM